MSRYSFLLLIIVSGAGLAVQSAINGRLREGVGSPVVAAAISFGVGLALLMGAALLGILSGESSTKAAPWWAYLGGALGAVYVLTAVIGVSRVGVATLTMTAIAGQLVASLAIDHFGWLGVARQPLSPVRIFGALLLFIGVLLVQRR